MKNCVSLKKNIFQAIESITIMFVVADIISLSSFDTEETILIQSTQSPPQNFKTSYFGRRTNGSLFNADINDELNSVDRNLLGWVETLYRLVLKQ